MSFLSPKELEKKGEELRKGWFEIYSLVEGLDKFRDPKSKEYQEYLGKLESEVKEKRNLTRAVKDSAMKIFSENRGEFESLSRGVEEALEKLAASIEKNLGDLEEYKKTLPKLENVQTELKGKNDRLKELREEKNSACNSYQDGLNRYEKKIEEVKEDTSTQLLKIRDKYISEIKELFEGYELLDEEGNKITLDLLFQKLVENPEYYSRVAVSPKGFFKRKSDLAARNIVLKYKAEDAKDEISPLLQEEREKIAEFEDERQRVEELKSQCESLSQSIESLEEEKDDLKSKEAKLRDALSGSGRYFSDYRSMLDLREECLGILDGVSSPREKFFNLIEDSIEGFQPQEPDREKRELRLRLKESREELEGKNSEITTLNSRIGELEKDLQAMEREKEALAGKGKELEESKQRLEGEIEKYKSHTRGLEKNLQERDKHIEGLNEEMEGLENRVKELSRELERAEGSNKELESRIGKLEESVKVKSEQISALEEEKGELSKKVKGLEEKNVSQKNKVKSLEDSLLEMEKNGRRQENRIKELQGERYNLEQKEKKTRGELEKSAQEVSRLKEENRDYRSRISALEERSGDREKKLLDLMEKLKSREAELQELKSEVGGLKGERETPEEDRKTKEPGGKDKSRDEAYVGEKLKDLRDRNTE